MSIESDFHALLAAWAPLTALVGARGIAQEAVASDAVPPFVVYTAEHQREHNLLGELVDDTAALTVQCWGRSPLQADQVAEQVLLALDTAAQIHYVAVLASASAYDGELDLHASTLTVEWSAA